MVGGGNPVNWNGGRFIEAGEGTCGVGDFVNVNRDLRSLQASINFGIHHRSRSIGKRLFLVDRNLFLGFLRNAVPSIVQLE